MDVNSLYDECHRLFSEKDGKLTRKVTTAPNAKVGDLAGWLDGDYYRVRVASKCYLVHRIIYLMHHKVLPEIVDHINGNTRDNLITNLRIATKKQNRWNCERNSTTISGYKGVYKDGKKWKALITRNGIRYYLGMHTTPELAAKAVETKSKELSGNYHRRVI